MASLFMLLLVWPNASFAEDIVLVAKKSSPLLLKLKENIEKQSKRFNVSIILNDSKVLPPKNSYLINVGLLEIDARLTQHTMGTISVLLTQEQNKKVNNQSAIYVEPPFKRQFDLAALLFPGAKIGLLVANQQQEDTYLGQLNSEEREQVNIKKLSDYSSLNKALYVVLKDASLLLGIYDDNIYNAKNIKNILITSYRQQKVLIGPSKAYLKAGSFASTYSNLSHVAKRIGDIVSTHHKEKRWLPADFNPYFSVRFNKQVANSLNIQAFNAHEVVQQMGGFSE